MQRNEISQTAQQHTSRGAARTAPSGGSFWTSAALALGLLALATFAAPAADEPAAAEQEQAPRVARLFKISLPITGRTTDEVRRSVLRVLERLRQQQVRPVLIFEFNVAPGQSEYGRGSKIGNAYDLADFLSSRELSDAVTVAYVPQSIQGHAVLPVLACQTIIMDRDAEIGPAGADEDRVTKSVLGNYEDIAGRHKKVPVEVALKLVDASRELLKVDTDLTAEYTTPQGLEKLAKQRTIRGQEIVFRAGEPARFSGSEARNREFIDRTASNYVELAQALDLPPESLKETAPLDGQWQAVQVDLRGPITADGVDRAERMIREAIERQGANFICLWIDSAGGSPSDAMRLAQYLAARDSGRVRTVAYIPREARADAALVAFGCDQIVMHPGAILGGEGDHAFPQDEIDDITHILRTDIAPKKSRSWSLPAATIDPALKVYRCRNLANVAYFSEEELAEQPKPDQWKKDEQPVTTEGRPFRANGSEAVEYRLANYEVNDFARFKELYELEEDPARLEPKWVDVLVEALASPGLAVLLLIIGGVALYAELHSPGIGVAGFVATVCFVLFFWSRFLGGTAGWLEVLLFLLGVAFLMLELFILPGFGIFGLGGGAMILASLVLASQTFILPHNQYQAEEFRNSLLTILASCVGIVAAVGLLNRWLPHAPVLSRLILAPPTPAESMSDDDEQAALQQGALLGAIGTTTTPLLPSGKARFGRTTLDVMTDGQYVPPGSEVEVIEARGNRILVRPVG